MPSRSIKVGGVLVPLDGGGAGEPILDADFTTLPNLDDFSGGGFFPAKTDLSCGTAAGLVSSTTSERGIHLPTNLTDTLQVIHGRLPDTAGSTTDNRLVAISRADGGSFRKWLSSNIIDNTGTSRRIFSVNAAGTASSLNSGAGDLVAEQDYWLLMLTLGDFCLTALGPSNPFDNAGDGYVDASGGDIGLATSGSGTRSDVRAGVSGYCGISVLGTGQTATVPHKVFSWKVYDLGALMA